MVASEEKDERNVTWHVTVRYKNWTAVTGICSERVSNNKPQ